MRTHTDLFDLTGDVAIITGGSRGIGFCLAEYIASAGAKIVLADLRDIEGTEAARVLKSKGYEADFVCTDVTQRTSVQSLVKAVIDRYGKLDILVNCAGIIKRAPMIDVSDEEWRLSMEVNLYGVFLCSQVAGMEMIKRKSGKIVNIASIAAQVAQQDQGVYAVSKAGVVHLTKAMAYEWARHGVRVNAIAPGPTMTDLTRAYFDEHPDVLAARLKSIPLGRLGEPSDFAGATLYLASNASCFMTGQTISIDGGFLLS